MKFFYCINLLTVVFLRKKDSIKYKGLEIIIMNFILLYVVTWFFLIFTMYVIDIYNSYLHSYFVTNFATTLSNVVMQKKLPKIA